MANMVKNNFENSQPIPVSDDEDDEFVKNFQTSDDNGNCEAAEESSKVVNEVNESPRQNPISPTSSPRDPSDDIITTTWPEKQIDILDNNIDNVSIENGSVGEADSKQDEMYGNGNLPENVSPEPANGNGENAKNMSASPSGSAENIIDDISIAKEMSKYIKVNRINWVEISNLKDMWAICDAISAAHYGLPDSLLKDAFLLVIQEHYSRSKHNWLRKQLSYLIKMWKHEIQSDKSMDRPTKFVAACNEYSPPTKKKRIKTNAQRKKALRCLMGVGDILQQARQRFATENGELDVEEDEHGSFTIGGQDLTFESWAEINRIKDDGVVYNQEAMAFARKPRKRKAGANQAARRAADTQLVMPSDVNANSSALLNASMVSSAKVDSIIKNPKKLSKQEKDEGELSESDESGDDSESGSSASSSDDEGSNTAAANATIRRKKKRQSQRYSGTSSAANVGEIIQKAYQYRFQIVDALNIQQKSSFLECLKAL